MCSLFLVRLYNFEKSNKYIDTSSFALYNMCIILLNFKKVEKNRLNYTIAYG